MLVAILTCFWGVRFKLTQRKQKKYTIYTTADCLTTFIVCQLATAAAVVVAFGSYRYAYMYVYNICGALQQAHIEYDSRHTEKCHNTRSFNEKLTLLTATKQVSSIAHQAVVT